MSSSRIITRCFMLYKMIRKAVHGENHNLLPTSPSSRLPLNLLYLPFICLLLFLHLQSLRLLLLLLFFTILFDFPCPFIELLRVLGTFWWIHPANVTIERPWDNRFHLVFDVFEVSDTDCGSQYLKYRHRGMAIG